MFTAFNENDFWKEIREKDYLSLKVDTVSTMLQDPTFARGETKAVIDILKEKVPEIFEEEIHLEYEERREEAQWDKEYFTALTYWFQKNFALSRIPYIQTVGRRVHADTEAAYQQSVCIPQPKAKTESKKQNPTKAPEQANKKNNLPLILGTTVAAGALALLVWWILS